MTLTNRQVRSILNNVSKKRFHKGYSRITNKQKYAIRKQIANRIRGH
jgi:hypothetical protein